MKKIILIVLTLVLSSLFLFGFENRNNKMPHERFLVYLDGAVIGTIKDKEKFESYIDNRGDSIKDKYKVNNVYPPENLEIKKVLTYNKYSDKVEDVYKKAEKMKAFTIKGFQFNIKREDKSIVVYTSSESVFESAIRSTIETFVGKETYELYNQNNQIRIDGVGRYIDSIYLDDEITFKETKVSVSEKIYNDSKELSKFLLFGNSGEQKPYTVKSGDTIESVAFANQISSEEFLISNPKFSSKNNLLFEGQEVVIGVIDPQVSVVIEEQTIEESRNDFKSEYKYDKNQIIGYEKIVQKGEHGLDLITRDVKTVNGVVVYASIVSREELKPAINQIVVRGEKQSPSVANTYSWRFPTDSGYKITQNYEWRRHPVTGAREFHQALDISIGYGANIYAVNNGVVVTAGYHWSYGNHVIINHNNGVYTLYSHMSKLFVKEGQVVPSGYVVGLMGSTGVSTGPHLHFEYWVGEPYRGGFRDNPWKLFR